MAGNLKNAKKYIVQAMSINCRDKETIKLLGEYDQKMKEMKTAGSF